MKTHYNAALHPATHVLPACRVGTIGTTKPRPAYHGTTDREKVTCKACLLALGDRK
ncbi:hypothetical protein [Trichloromonas acetexigens]|jgi:hypothetical protein|uniref:hypothetical protein n=1 Tax=Trichloromonas acetexigens TaxID=38815 RepID=UPI0014791C83|nr:hypothetical protein [Desulfuromonas acetexigens]